MIKKPTSKLTQFRARHRRYLVRGGLSKFGLRNFRKQWQEMCFVVTACTGARNHNSN